MRRADLLLLTGSLLLTGVLLAAPVAARAQSWDAAGPGRDVLGAAIGEMDAFRGRLPAPSQRAALPFGAGEARAPIPILDWAAPTPREPVEEQRRRLPRR